MTKVILQRVKQSSMGTLGVISIDGAEVCQCLELPWVDVELDGLSDKNVSCVNAGSYIGKRVVSPKFGDVFEIAGIPNRDHVLIHKGNSLKDIKGCVAVGMQSGEANGEFCVYRSKEAFGNFMKILENINEFEIEIREVK